MNFFLALKFYGPIRLFHLFQVDLTMIIGKVKVECIDKKNLSSYMCFNGFKKKFVH